MLLLNTYIELEMIWNPPNSIYSSSLLCFLSSFYQEWHSTPLFSPCKTLPIHPLHPVQFPFSMMSFNGRGSICRNNKNKFQWHHFTHSTLYYDYIFFMCLILRVKIKYNFISTTGTRTVSCNLHWKAWQMFIR